MKQDEDAHHKATADKHERHGKPDGDVIEEVHGHPACQKRDQGVDNLPAGFGQIGLLVLGHNLPPFTGVLVKVCFFDGGFVVHAY